MPLRRITDAATVDLHSPQLDESSDGSVHLVPGQLLDDGGASIPRRAARTLAVWFIASVSMVQVRTRPTFLVVTSPLCSSTCRCWTTAGSDIENGWANSLTEAGPLLNRSTI